MTLQYFADSQNLVFVPALLALLLATLLICLPIVFAPALRRGRRPGRRALVAVAAVVAAVALVTAGWQAGVGVRTLQQVRADAAQQLQDRYGLRLGSGDVNELVNGGAPLLVLPQQAAAVGLATVSSRHALQLKREDGSSALQVTFGRKVLPPSA